MPKQSKAQLNSNFQANTSGSTNEVNDLKVTLDATKATLATREDKITELTRNMAHLRQTLRMSANSTAAIKSNLEAFAKEAREQETIPSGTVTALNPLLVDNNTNVTNTLESPIP